MKFGVNVIKQKSVIAHRFDNGELILTIQLLDGKIYPVNCLEQIAFCEMELERLREDKERFRKQLERKYFYGDGQEEIVNKQSIQMQIDIDAREKEICFLREKILRYKGEN